MSPYSHPTINHSSTASVAPPPHIDPRLLSAATPQQSYFSLPSTAPAAPVLHDATGAVVNAPIPDNTYTGVSSVTTVPEPVQKVAGSRRPTRKRKASTSGGTSGPRKVRRRIQVPSEPPSAASIVGTGPSNPPAPSEPTAPMTSSQAESTTPSTAAQEPVPQTLVEISGSVITSYRSIRQRHQSTESRARDVWYFVRALESTEMPATLPSTDGEQVLTCKPSTPWVGCKLCRDEWKVFSNSDGVTSTLRRHLREKHSHEYEETCKSLGFSPKPRINLQRAREPFTPEGLLERLIRWVSVDDQSINLIECPEFRELLIYLHPGLSDKDIPHRTLLTQQILLQYWKEHQAMVAELQASPGRVSFTLDLWEDQERMTYMGLTAHHCEERPDLVLRSHLLMFRSFPSSHSGANVSLEFYNTMTHACIKHKIGQITMDNTSSNDTMMVDLEARLLQDGIPFHHDGNRIRCFPHVVNIANQLMLDELKTNPSEPVLALVEAGTPDRDRDRCQAYADALAADPIQKVRDLVSALRQSGQRRNELLRFIADGVAAERWKDTPQAQQLRPLQLLRDCNTRWSSTFLMIDRTLLLYPAISDFLMHPAHIELARHLLTQNELAVLTHLYQIFEVSHQAQQLVSAEKTPTLSLVLPAYELLVDTWQSLRQQLPELSHYINLGITKIQEYIHRSRKSRIYALAMILNPMFKLNWIREHWTAAEAHDAEEWIVEAMLAYRQEQRRARHANATAFNTAPRRSSSLPAPAATTAAQSLARGMAGLRRLNDRVRRAASVPEVPDTSIPPGCAPASTPTLNSSHEGETSSTSEHLPNQGVVEVEDQARDRAAVLRELESYLEEPSPAEDIESNHDLLHYWTTHKCIFPYLYHVALDVLPAQAAGVPCERVFSSGKETDTLRRSQLHPVVMEALQVLKYRYGQERLDFTSGIIAREEDCLRESGSYTGSHSRSSGAIMTDTIHHLLSQGRLNDVVQFLYPADN